MAPAPGASGMTQVCRPTPLVRFMQHARDKLKATHVSHGTMTNTGAFLPTTLCRGTQRNTLPFARCKRTTCLFLARDEKVEMVAPPAGGAAFIPRRERRSLSPRFGNRTISKVASAVLQ